MYKECRNVMRNKYIQKNKLLTLCIIWVSCLLFLSNCVAISGTEGNLDINIVVIGPFSGDLSDLGKSMRNGIVLATEEQNARGGLLGQQIKLSLFDSRCDYANARRVTQQAVRETGASYILGALCSEASEGVAQIASDEGVLMINPASVSEGLTLDNDGEVRPLVFRIPFTDPNQGSVAAMIALEKLKVDTAGVMVASSSLYESSLADAFSTTFNVNGGEALFRESYDKNAESFFDVLSELQSENVDIIYVPTYTDVVNKIAAQARAFGMNQVFIGSDGWNSPQLNKVFLDGSYFTVHFSADDPRTAVREWVRKYEDRYLVVPDTVSTLSFDAANVLFTAIERSGKSTPYELAAAMEEMEFMTVLGPVKFDEMHNPIKPVIVLQVTNGEIVYDSSVNPNDERE